MSCFIQLKKVSDVRFVLIDKSFFCKIPSYTQLIFRAKTYIKFLAKKAKIEGRLLCPVQAQILNSFNLQLKTGSLI